MTGRAYRCVKGRAAFGVSHRTERANLITLLEGIELQPLEYLKDNFRVKLSMVVEMQPQQTIVGLKVGLLYCLPPNRAGFIPPLCDDGNWKSGYNRPCGASFGSSQVAGSDNIFNGAFNGHFIRESKFLLMRGINIVTHRNAVSRDMKFHAF